MNIAKLSIVVASLSLAACAAEAQEEQRSVGAHLECGEGMEAVRVLSEEGEMEEAEPETQPETDTQPEEYPEPEQREEGGGCSSTQSMLAAGLRFLDISINPGQCNGDWEYKKETETTKGETEAEGKGLIVSGKGKVGGEKTKVTESFVCKQKPAPPAPEPQQ